MNNSLKLKYEKIVKQLMTIYSTTIKVATTTKSPNPLLKKVVKVDGKITSVIALVTYSKNGKPQKRVLRVLLDSGSNGDLLFLHEGTRGICKYFERIKMADL